MRGSTTTTTTMLGELIPKLRLLRTVVALRGAIEIQETYLAISPPRRQVLQLSAWAASARGLDGTATTASVHATCRAILEYIGRIAQRWWPGAILSLGRNSTASHCARRLHLRSCRTWTELADTASAAAKHVTDWSDNDRLSPQPDDAGRLLESACTQLVLPSTNTELGELRAPERVLLSLTDLERLAGELRWVRRTTDRQRWSDAFGQLRRVFQNLINNKDVDTESLVTLKERLNAGYRPSQSWAMELGGTRTSDRSTHETTTPSQFSSLQSALQQPDSREPSLSSETSVSPNEQVACLREQVRCLREELAAAQELLDEEAAKAQEHADELNDLRTKSNKTAEQLPQLCTVRDALTFATTLYDERLVIHPSAWSSAEKSRYRQPRLVFDVLAVMALTIGADLKPQIDSLFGGKARYRSKDSPQTHQRFGSYRTLPTCGGGQKCYTKHITLGHGEHSGQCLQIYFDLTADGRYELAWIGDHLPTVSHNT